MKCKFVNAWKCHNKKNPSIPECEFCLKARLAYVSQYRPIDQDYGKNLKELNDYRQKEKELPK